MVHTSNIFISYSVNKQCMIFGLGLIWVTHLIGQEPVGIDGLCEAPALSLG